MDHYAIILASGRGLRFGNNSAKHLAKIGGIPVLIWCITSVIQVKKYCEIVIVIDKKYEEDTYAELSKFSDLNSNRITLVHGSTERMVSFFNGYSYLLSRNINQYDALITLVDANRPFTSASQYKAISELAAKHHSSCLARPIVNGVAKINGNNIVQVPNKNEFVEFVTPECIKSKLLNDLDKHNFIEVTSLVDIALNRGVFPKIFPSTDLNFKLTYPDDSSYLNSLIQKYKISPPNLNKNI